MADPVWFPCFAAIPGVDYTAPAGVNAAALPGYGARPEVHRYEAFPPALIWADTSESPAREHAYRALRGRSLDALLTRVAEVLELPGEPTDYHYSIQDAIGQLYKRRNREPHALGDMERLCWLDIALVQAQPQAFLIGGDNPGYVTVFAFQRLLELYTREGLLGDAMRVLEIAHRYGATTGRTAQQLPDRYATILAEDHGTA